MWYFKFSRQRVWCSELSSGIYCRVKLLSADVSEVHTASIIRDHPWWCNTAVSLITLFVNRYDNWFLPLVRQLFFVPDQHNKFMYLRMQCIPPPAWISSAGIWSEPGAFYRWGRSFKGDISVTFKGSLLDLLYHLHLAAVRVKFLWSHWLRYRSRTRSCSRLLTVSAICNCQ
jgi:hypothetical protein